MNFRISIPQPCHEDWHEMTIKESGRFCSSCQTIVTDFTVMSDVEIIQHFKSNNGKICGKFYESQLEREFIETTHQKSFWLNLPKFSAAASILFSLLQLPVFAKTNVEIKVEQTPNQSDSTTMNYNKYVQVKGKIINEETGNPLDFIAVTIKDKNGIIKGRAYTDDNGSFIIKPLDFSNDTFTVFIRDIHFNSIEPINIVLDSNEIDLGIVCLKKNIRSLQVIKLGGSIPMYRYEDRNMQIQARTQTKGDRRRLFFRSLIKKIF